MLIDTSALIWYGLNPERLSKRAARVIDPGRLHEAQKYLEAITGRTPGKVADWLARAAEAPQEVVRLSPEAAKAILDERARALARARDGVVLGQARAP